MKGIFFFVNSGSKRDRGSRSIKFCRNKLMSTERSVEAERYGGPVL